MKKRKSWGKSRIGHALAILLLVSFMIQPLQVQAYTVYLSDETAHEEGYIIIGESHIVISATALYYAVLEDSVTPKLRDLSYYYCWDASVETDNGEPNTFTMQGNLFFVFEGNSQEDASTQLSPDYIYSDGQGNRGRGVEKIHEIMDTNPNIKHWNIISYAGAVSALEGAEAGAQYVESYRNWITYEFPTAEIYFLSHSILTKYYRPSKDAYLFDEAIKEAFPDKYLDYSGFYQSRYPQQMRDPEMKPDNIHWNDTTYVTLFGNVMWQIETGIRQIKRELKENRNEEKENTVTNHKRYRM